MATKKKARITGAAVEAKAKKKTPRIFSLTIDAERKDLEADFACLISGDDLNKRRLKLTGKKQPKLSGQFCRLVKQRDGSIKVEKHRVKNTEGLKAFLVDDITKKSKLLETDTFALGFDGGGATGGLPPNNEYAPLQGGPFNKQLYYHDYLAMHARCFETKNHNPLAKEIVDVITFFSMGKGLKVVFRNSELQDKFKIFEERNRLNEFLRMDSDTITWAGEIMTHKVKAADGYPLLKHMDPSGVWEVVTNPRDIDEIYYYHQQFPTQYQLVYKPKDEAQAYVILDIPADEVIWKKINTVPGEKRGRSDLFAILTWLKRFKDYYDARVTKAQLEESWAMKKKIKGNLADITELMNDPAISAVPSPGSVLLENDAIDSSYMTPTASSTGSGTDNIGEAIRSICATGAGLSPEYLGVAGKSSSRATSITRAEPAVRKFEDRQMFFEIYVRDIVAYWLAAAPGLPTKQVRPASMAALKKALRERRFLAVIQEATALMGLGQIKENIDTSFEVIFPEIGVEDRTAKITDIYTAQAMRTFTKRRASTMVAKELGVTSYDFDEEQEEMREEEADRQADPLYNGAPDPAMAMLQRRQDRTQAGKQDGNAQDDKDYAEKTQQ